MKSRLLLCYLLLVVAPFVGRAKVLTQDAGINELEALPLVTPLRWKYHIHTRDAVVAVVVVVFSIHLKKKKNPVTALDRDSCLELKPSVLVVYTRFPHHPPPPHRRR